MLAPFMVEQMLPQKLHSMAECSLSIIERSSTIQIDAAIKHNQNHINKLLVQLLAINFINNNKNDILNDISKINNRKNNNNNNDTNNMEIPSNIEVNENNNNSLCKDESFYLQNYCERKLLNLSPILGFGQKDYFFEYNINNDIIIHILSFIKINEYYKTIIKINKYFKNTIKNIFEESNYYLNNININNYKFNNFNDIIKNYFQKDRLIDYRCYDGHWSIGKLKNYNRTNLSITLLSADGKYLGECPWEHVAPCGTMTLRPLNLKKFKTILKNGYYGMTCNVNLKGFNLSYDSNNVFSRFANIINDNVSHLVGSDRPHMWWTRSHNVPDMWLTGYIDFDLTLKRSNEISYNIYGIKNDDNINDNKLLLYQIAVKIDITQYYNSHVNELKQEIDSWFYISRCNVNYSNIPRIFVTLWFRIDDIYNFSKIGVHNIYNKNITNNTEKYILEAAKVCL